MGVILDTSILIAAEKGFLELEKVVSKRENEFFGITTITVSELLHGVHRADSEKRRLKREAYVEKIIETFPIYSFDLNAARIYARVWAQLVKKGDIVGAHDLMTASICISLGCSIITYDTRDYGRIKGLILEVVH
jgi:tRNA(fMet)-specific endonuclease VapC